MQAFCSVVRLLHTHGFSRQLQYNDEQHKGQIIPIEHKYAVLRGSKFVKFQLLLIIVVTFPIHVYAV